jgi:hypothetical protein
MPGMPISTLQRKLLQNMKENNDGPVANRKNPLFKNNLV